MDDFLVYGYQSVLDEVDLLIVVMCFFDQFHRYLMFGCFVLGKAIGFTIGCLCFCFQHSLKNLFVGLMARAPLYVQGTTFFVEDPALD